MNGMTFDGYIQVLGTLMKADDGDAVMDTFPKTVQRQFLLSAMEEGIGGYCLWKAPHSCSKFPDLQQPLQSMDYKLQVRNNLQKQALLKLFAGLEERHIFFVPLKGADLAYRIYPCCQLRMFLDFDILFRRENWQDVEDFFRSEGWHCDSWKIIETRHHTAPIVKGTMLLEPHWMLPCFDGVSAEELWNYCRPAAPGSYRCVLTPEVNVLMLVRHLREYDYIRCKVSRFLLDVHFLLRHETINWGIMHDIVHQWNFANPGDLLGAFPEVFGDSWLNQASPDLQQSQVFREIFRRREAFTGYSVHDVQVHKLMAGQLYQVMRWMCHFKPSTVRRNYHLPPDVNGARLAWYTAKDVCIKIRDMVMGMTHPHHDLKTYLALVEKVSQR